MEQNTLRRILLFCFAVAISLSSSLYAQVTADVGVNGFYTPNAFTKYSTNPVSGTVANGFFGISLTKGGATIPANGFKISISLAPEVAYTGEVFSIPAGFTLNVINSTTLEIIQSSNYTGSGLSALKDFNIPVQATAPVSPPLGPPNWSVSIVPLSTPPSYTDGGTANNASNGRVSVVDSPLPVTLVSFNVKGEGAIARLTWQTTEETNSDYFEIQHSMDAKNWSAVKKVESHKDSKALNTYTDTHNNPQKGINYYRLKMVDRDLTFAYSGVKSIDFEGGMRAIIYPNPVSNVIFVRDLGADFKDIKEVSILNQTGQVYYKSNRLSADGIPVQNIPTGNYVLQVRKSSNAIHTFKVAVVR